MGKLKAIHSSIVIQAIQNQVLVVAWKLENWSKAELVRADQESKQAPEALVNPKSQAYSDCVVFFYVWANFSSQENEK